MPQTIGIERTIEGIDGLPSLPPGSEPRTQPVFLTEDMIDLKIHLVFGGRVGDGTYPVVITVVIWAPHIHIRQRKCRHHLERRRVDEVSRRGRKLIPGAI